MDKIHIIYLCYLKLQLNIDPLSIVLKHLVANQLTILNPMFQ